jgi:hypothetical protein
VNSILTKVKMWSQICNFIFFKSDTRTDANGLKRKILLTISSGACEISSGGLVGGDKSRKPP